MYETKTHLEPAQLKADFSQRTIEGYASTFGNVDQVGDVVVSGAFRKTLSDRLPRKLIKVFYDHSIPIGMPLDGSTEDGTGLWTLSKVLDGPEFTKYLQFVQEGLTAHMSFSYDVVRREYIQPTDTAAMPIRRLLEVKVYEWGPVHWPANEQAQIVGLKELSESLREAKARIPELAKLLGKKGYLRDPELDLIHHLGVAVSQAIADSIKALSEAEPEPLADTPSDAATTPPAEPPPQTAGDEPATGDESLLDEIAVQLASLRVQLAASGGPAVPSY